MRIWLILEESSLEKISKDHLVPRASGLKSIIPPKISSWCDKQKCWAERSRCSVPGWLPEHSLIPRAGADVCWRRRARWVQRCLPSKVWVGVLASRDGAELGVTAVQGGITSRKPGQELRSDDFFPGEHQAKEHNPKVLQEKFSLNWWTENQSFFPSCFIGLSCMHNAGLFCCSCASWCNKDMLRIRSPFRSW